jgi:hypothetical protein
MLIEGMIWTHCADYVLGLACHVCCCAAQVRFAKHVFPGESLLVEMWQTSATKVVFQTRVKGRGDLAISNAAVEFHQGKLVTSSSDSSKSSRRPKL